jgi:HK97 family phage major capsid protein
MSILKEARARLDAKREEMRAVSRQLERDSAEKNGKLTAESVEKLTGIGAEADKLTGTAKAVRVAEWIREKTEEIDALAVEVDSLQAAEKDLSDFTAAEKTVKRPAMPSGQKPAKSLGQLVTEHPEYKRIAAGGARTTVFEIPDIQILGGQKTLFQTTAGWAPETTRTGMVVDDVTRPIQLIDIMPSAPTSQAAVVYMEETTRTHSAAEIAEEGAYPEDAYALTERTSTVRKIGTSIPVTDEQLADVPFAEAYLNQRMPFGVRQRLDSQLINGDGIAPNLEGFVNVTGVQTRAFATNDLDTIYNALDDVRVTGPAMPTHVVMHSTDWAAIRLLQTADGVYIYGSPADAGPERVWGLPLVKNEALTATNALVGSFEMSWTYLAERAGIVVEVGYVNDDFTDGRRTIRAQGRWALVVGRPAAFCYVTGL